MQLVGVHCSIRAGVSKVFGTVSTKTKTVGKSMCAGIKVADRDGEASAL